MDDNKRVFHFSSEVLKVFSLAYRISVSCRFPCVTDLACFVALNSISDSPLYKRATSSGFDKDKISKVNAEILNEYQLTSRYQKGFKILAFQAYSQSYTISEPLYSVLEKASDIGENLYEKEEIGYNELLAAFAECMPNVYESFLKKCNIYPKPNNQLLKEEKTMKIPHEMSGFLTILNDNFSPTETT